MLSGACTISSNPTAGTSGKRCVSPQWRRRENEYAPSVVLGSESGGTTHQCQTHRHEIVVRSYAPTGCSGTGIRPSNNVCSPPDRAKQNKISRNFHRFVWNFKYFSFFRVTELGESSPEIEMKEGQQKKKAGGHQEAPQLRMRKKSKKKLEDAGITVSSRAEAERRKEDGGRSASGGPAAAKRGARPPMGGASARAGSVDARARLYEVLAVACLILAVLVGVATYLYYFEPQVAQHLEKSLTRTSAFVSRLTGWPGDGDPDSGGQEYRWADWFAHLAGASPSPGAPAPKKKKKQQQLASRLYTASELREYDGRDATKPLMLSILGAWSAPLWCRAMKGRAASCQLMTTLRHSPGKVYDVTAGSKHYAKGGDYHFFTGRDASRSFATGG